MPASRRPGVFAHPSRLSALFGRESTLPELADLIERRPLITLAGPPGIGKTRLGIEVLARATRGGRKALVELAGVGDPLLAGTLVGAGLGVRAGGSRTIEEALIEGLRAEEALVVLDGCEDVAGPMAKLSGVLLAACPRLRILATSRVPLEAPGEQLWRVPPLDLPSAAGLFVDRAGLVCDAIRGRGAGAAEVETICRRLDGVPLAIELAAGWTRVLSPAQIAERLDTLPIAATMAKAVEPSYGRLAPAARVLFERAALFPGGFDLAALRAVAGEDELPVLASLVDHSLIQVEPSSGEPVRFRVLGPLRDYGVGRLQARRHRPAAARAHALHYLHLALDAAPALRARDPRALRHLDAEVPNLRAALDWARAQDGELGLRLATALALFWAQRGRAPEGRRWLEQMLGTGTVDPALRATALSRAGRLAMLTGDTAGARAWLERSLAIEYQLGDDHRIARRLRRLAVVSMMDRNLAEACTLGERSAATFRAREDPDRLAWTLIFLAATRHLAGEGARASVCAQEALELSRSCRNTSAMIYCLSLQALSLLAGGRPDRARPLLAEAYRAIRELGGLADEPGWLWTGIALACAEERHRAALRLAGGVRSMARSGVLFNAQFRRRLLPALERARGAVGVSAADGLADEGESMGVEQLIAEAMAEPLPSAWAPLSTREREVTELVTQGLTNVEIASRLFISKRTVESHVEHVKNKLALCSRTQVIAWGLGIRANPDGADPSRG